MILEWEASEPRLGGSPDEMSGQDSLPAHRAGSRCRAVVPDARNAYLWLLDLRHDRLLTVLVGLGCRQLIGGAVDYFSGDLRGGGGHGKFPGTRGNPPSHRASNG